MNLDTLKDSLNQVMGTLAQSPSLEKVLTPGFADRRLYAIYLVETYHYTKHNARNQALVATRPDDMDPRYMKFCLKHAEEEVGHEMMAVHDLRNMGYDVSERTLGKPLAETEVLISYLYRVAATANPLARLGYSYWAERSYHYIQPILDMLKSGLGVQKNQMSFFTSHAEIDVDHAKQVDETISRFAKTLDDWKAIEEVMRTSLILTSGMMEAVFAEFIKMKEGKSDRYPFISPK